jgi:hypothetical protein
MGKKNVIAVLALGMFIVFANRSYGCPTVPIANIIADPCWTVVGTSVTLNGSSSVAGCSGGQINSWEWDPNYNGTTFHPTEYNSTIHYTYTSPGIHTVALRVKDSCPGDLSGMAYLNVYVGSAERTRVFYVKKGATGSGTSWKNALGDINNALVAAQGNGGGQIWVSQGTYIPSKRTDIYDSRSATFQLINGVGLYGGFDCNGTTSLWKDFNDGDSQGWTIVNDSGQTSSWSASSGKMVQSNMVGISNDGIADRGTYAWYQNGTEWEDYHVSATLKTSGTYSIGIMFRYQDVNNYYRFSMDRYRQRRLLVKKVAGTVTLLAGDSVACVQGRTYNTEIVAQGSEIKVVVDGNVVFSVIDDSLAKGSVALYSYRDNSCTFDDVNVMGYPTRNWQAYPTVLSGDINNNDVGDLTDSSRFENAYHVVTGSGTDNSAVLDGFTIANGHAWVNSADDDIYSGGGIYNISGSPSIVNCRFQRNSAHYKGGAMYNYNSSPIVENCTFWSNHTNHYGGAVYNASYSNPHSSPKFINCLITKNTSLCWYCSQRHGDGGGFYNDYYCDSQLVNCTIRGNYAKYFGGVLNRSNSSSDGLVAIVNSILWGNTAADESSGIVGLNIGGIAYSVSYSCIQDSDANDSSIPFGGGANHNIDDNPRFVSADGNDYRLQAGSPCIDAGDNNAVPQGITTDINGIPRILDGDGNGTSVVDMGAYEYVAQEPPTPEGNSVVIISAGEYAPIMLPKNEPNVQLVGRIIRDDANVIHRTYWELIYNPKGANIVFAPNLPAQDFNSLPNTRVISPCVTFPNDVNYAGNYGIRLVAEDINGKVLARDIAWIMLQGGNKGPTVIPGSYNPVEIGQALQLRGVVYDDGQPRGILSKQWSFYSNNPNSPQGAEVRFADASDPCTTVIFTRTGDYVLKLWASDGDLETEHFTTIKVVNHDEPPSVEAGADKTIYWGQTHQVALTGANVSDDGGLNNLDVNWSLVQVSDGNGTVISWGTYTKEHPEQATPIFTGPGVYWLQLTANDHNNSPVSDVVKVVVFADVNVSVFAGNDATIYVGNNVYPLDEAYVANAPTGSILHWTVEANSLFLNGPLPSSPSFNNPNIQNPVVTFGESGVYTLTLTVSKDGSSLAGDSVQITVSPRKQKKLYVITDCEGGLLKEFTIEHGAQLRLVRSAYVNITNVVYPIINPTGLTIDSDSENLFLGYDHSFNHYFEFVLGWEYLGILNMNDISTVPAIKILPSGRWAGAGMACGIVYENNEPKRKFFCISRESNKLSIYNLDMNGQPIFELNENGEPNGLSPIVKTLKDDTGTEDIKGMDIAFDEQNQRLYIANVVSPNKIYIYNVTDTDTQWESQTPIILGKAAVGIDISRRRDNLGYRYLYAGAINHCELSDCFYSHNYLIRYNLDTGDEKDVYMNSPVFDIAVDQETGDVYTTQGEGIGSGGSFGQIKVFSSDPCYCLASYSTDSVPSGLCILNDIDLSKSARLNLDINDACDGNVVPGQTLQYTIRCVAPSGESNAANNLHIYCDLPKEVDFNTFDSNSVGSYYALRHRIEWFIGTLSDGNALERKFYVKVNKKARPFSSFAVRAEAESDQYYSVAEHKTDVNYWSGADPNILYVNCHADGNNNGTSWKDAYRTLDEALRIARLSRNEPNHANRIYVAAGTYYADIDRGNFRMIDGVDIYGGFVGYESSPQQRNLRSSDYLAILRRTEMYDGYGNYVDNSTVEANNAVIDGFVITGGSVSEAGIKCDGVSATIRNCTIEDNNGYGVLCHPGYNGGKVIIEDNRICRNAMNAIYCEGGVSTLRGNLIYENLYTESAIDLGYVNDVNFYNNTIVNNRGRAVSCSNGRAYLRNCIIWGNRDELYDWEVKLFNCCTDEIGWAGLNGNINEDPCFINSPDFIDKIESDSSDYTTQYSFVSSDGTIYEQGDYIEIGYDGKLRQITGIEISGLGGNQRKISFEPNLSSLPKIGTVIRSWVSNRSVENVNLDESDVYVTPYGCRYYEFNVTEPNKYAVNDTIMIDTIWGVWTLLVTEVDYVTNKVKFVPDFIYDCPPVAEVQVTNFRHWIPGRLSEDYHLRPGSACINMGAGLGSKDVTIAVSADNNEIIVTDANFYPIGDVIEVNDDNTLRFVEEIIDNKVKFGPPVNTPPASSTKVTNWAGIHNIDTYSLDINSDYYTNYYYCNCPLDGCDVVVMNVNICQPGDTLKFYYSYDGTSYYEYVVVRDVNQSTNTITFTSDLLYDYTGHLSMTNYSSITGYRFTPDNNVTILDIDSDRIPTGDMVDIGADEFV